MAEDKKITLSEALKVVKEAGATVFQTKSELESYKNEVTQELENQVKELRKQAEGKGVTQKQYEQLAKEVKKAVGLEDLPEDKNLGKALSKAIEDSKNTDATLQELKNKYESDIDAIKKDNASKLASLQKELEAAIEKEKTIAEQFTSFKTNVAEQEQNKLLEQTFKKQGFNIPEEHLEFVLPSVISKFKENVEETETASGEKAFKNKSSGDVYYNAGKALSIDGVFAQYLGALDTFKKKDEGAQGKQTATPPKDSNGNAAQVPESNEWARKEAARKAADQGGNKFMSVAWQKDYNAAIGEEHFKVETKAT